MQRRYIFLLAIWLFFGLGGCSEIRYSRVTPEARDFHPRAIAVLSLDVGSHGETRETLDRLVSAKLTDKNRSRKVLSAQAVLGFLKENEDLRKTTATYLGKLESVNFSDSDLSRKIGELIGADAFLLVNLDYWYYTKEEDKNIAKVGLSMKMIRADTGVVVWKGTHFLAPDYVLLKPELTSVAADVVGQMVGAMPN